MGEADREEKFTTIRINDSTRTLLDKLSLPREAIWETTERITKAFAVAILKKERKVKK